MERAGAIAPGRTGNAIARRMQPQGHDVPVPRLTHLQGAWL